MSLSRKHYKLVAETLVRYIKDRNMRILLCNELGSVFKQDNPAFDWQKWRDACDIYPKPPNVVKRITE